jgi:putative membrane protein
MMRAMTQRRPRWVYGTGEEPDARFSLANERTFLAWVRTSIGVLAGGFALHTLVLPSNDGARTVLTLSLVALAGACAVLSATRWARVERAMRRGEPLPAFFAGPVLLTSAIVLMAALLVVLVVV